MADTKTTVPAIGNIRLKDGLQNVMTGLGTGKSKSSYSNWQYAWLSNYQQLEACYQSNWIARQIIDIPSQDMTREWRTIKSKYAEEIAAEEQRLSYARHVYEGSIWSRLYGGSAVLMVTDQPFDKPLDVNKISKGGLKNLIVFDRWELSPISMNYTDILKPNFYLPEKYIVTQGSQEIHHSHFARFQGELLPRRLALQTQGWGDSVLRKCIEDVTDSVAAKSGISELMQEANIDVITAKDLASNLSTDQEDEIVKRYEMFSLMKSTINMALLDGDETLTRNTLNLSGVAPILELLMTWISGASRIPVTKLFGTSAKGLNATGEGDLNNYYDDARALQKSSLNGPLRTLDEVMVRSAVGYWPDDFDYVWNPLAQPNSVELAQAQLLDAQKSTLYLNSGVVQKSQIQRNLQSSEEYQFDDEEIKELEELEASNPLESLPDLNETEKDET